MEAAECENIDALELCRTCGVYYSLDDGNLIVPFYTKNGLNDAFDVSAVLKQMSAWHIEVAQNDGRPQHICLVCIEQFEKFNKFKNSCIETQDQFEFRECERQMKAVVVKKEKREEKVCAYIYLDTDDEEDGSARVDEPDEAIPHVPIKMEHMARVPQENVLTYEPPKPFELTAASTNGIKEENPAFKYCIDPMIATIYLDLADEEEDSFKITKFTYDDDKTPSPLSVVAPKAIFTCIHCTHQTDTQELLQAHVQRFHTLKNVDCHICGKTFTNANHQRVKFHMKWHKINKHVQCPVCGYLCDSKDTLKEHRLAVHTSVKCEHCGKKVKRKLLKKHLAQHANADGKKLVQEKKNNDAFNRFPCCPFCFKKVADALQLELHLKEVHASPLQQKQHLSEMPIADSTINNNDDTNCNGNKSVISDELKDAHAAPQSPSKTQCAAGSTVSLRIGKIVNDESDFSSDLLCSSQDDSMLIFSNSSVDSDTNETSKKACYKCHFCGKAYNLKIKLNLHLKTHRKAPF